MKSDQRRSFPYVFATILAASSVTGCGGSGVEVGYVTGQVTVDGIPVTGARVSFHPEEGGRMSQAVTDEDGYYELAYTADQEGALIGKHKVTLSTGGPTFDEETGEVAGAPEMFSEEYNSRTRLTATVEPGDNVFDWRISLDD